MTTSEFIQEVGIWAEQNFGTIQEGRRIPHYGLVEEVGEAVHCLLKHHQKIRGYEVEDFFKKELQDAFADIIIYLADYAYCHRAFFKFLEVEDKSIEYLRDKGEELIIGRVAQCLSSIMNYECSVSMTPEIAEISVYSMMSQSLCSNVSIWAAFNGFNLQDITWLTWSKVSKRDWNKESHKGGE